MGDRFKKQKAKGGERITSPEQPISTDTLVPIFCLQYLQNHYSLTDCEKDEKSAFADSIYSLSRQTWAQLLQRHRHKGGYEKIAQDAIKTGIPDVVTPDTNLIAFRFDGMKPMVGFRKGVTFHILWLDREFNLYNHG